MFSFPYVVIEEKVLVDEKVLEESKTAAKNAKEAVKEQKDKMHKNNKEINVLQSRRETLAVEVKDKELIVKELEHKISKAIEDAHNADRTVKHMLKQFEWITVDQKFFGEPGSAYDFKATDPKDAAKRVQRLEENKVCTVAPLQCVIFKSVSRILYINSTPNEFKPPKTMPVDKSETLGFYYANVP